MNNYPISHQTKNHFKSQLFVMKDAQTLADNKKYQLKFKKNIKIKLKKCKYSGS